MAKLRSLLMFMTFQRFLGFLPCMRLDVVVVGLVVVSPRDCMRSALSSLASERTTANQSFSRFIHVDSPIRHAGVEVCLSSSVTVLSSYRDGKLLFFFSSSSHSTSCYALASPSSEFIFLSYVICPCFLIHSFFLSSLSLSFSPLS